MRRSLFHILAILRRELFAYFLSPLAYIVWVAFLLLNGYIFFAIISFLSDPIGPGGAPMPLFFGGSLLYWLVQVFFMSAITMRLFAEDARQGTLENTLTTPISEASLAIGKYLGALCFYIFLWLPTLLYVGIIIAVSNTPQDMGQVASGYFGTFILGVFFLALGLFASSLSRNQLIAAILSILFSSVFIMLSVVKDLTVLGTWRDAIIYLDLFGHMARFGRGILDSRPIVLSFSGAAFFLFAAVASLELRRLSEIVLALISPWRDISELLSRLATGKDGRAGALFRLLLLLLSLACLVLLLDAFAGFGLVAPLSGPWLLLVLLLCLMFWVGAFSVSSAADTSKRVQRILSNEAPRSGARAALWVVSLLSAAALFIGVNVVSSRHYTRRDWTYNGFYSLSPDSIALVQSVTTPIDVVVFLTPEDPRFGSFFPDVSELISQLEVTSDGKVRAEFVDPLRDRTRAEFLYQKYKLPQESDLNVVLFSNPSLERVKYIYGEEMAEFQNDDYGPRLSRFLGEEAFVSALLNVSEPKKRKVYFTTGHGEAPLTTGGQRALSELAAALRDDNIEVAELAFTASPLPKDAEVLWIVGPTQSFQEAEAKQLEAFVNNGGRLFLALDPTPATTGEGIAPSGLSRLLSRWNLTIDETIVFDPDPAAHIAADDSVYSQALLLAQPTQDHVITRGMSALRVAIPGARSVGTLEAAGRKVAVLLSTSKSAWGERNFLPDVLPSPQSADLNGPLPLMASSEDLERGGRVVIAGASSFLFDSYLGGPSNRNPGNYQLALRASRWLLSRDQLIETTPKTPLQVRLQLSASNSRAILWLLLGGIPMLGVLLGLYVWQARRR
jgi:ABC-2 type transport system permease protein